MMKRLLQNLNENEFRHVSRFAFFRDITQILADKD